MIAAYTAAMQHKQVILIEPGKHPGGLSTGGLGYTDIGNKYAITGIARDFYRRLRSTSFFVASLMQPRPEKAMYLPCCR